MGDSYTMARNLVLTMLLNENIVTDEMITGGIDKVKLMLPDLDTAALATDLIAHYGIISGAYSILEDQLTQQPPWLDLARPGLEWKFWSRYRQYLQLDRRIPANTVGQLSDLTDDILDRLADPKAGKPFDRRGMVVGQVQSGKTANYSGLICKAADAGYRIIIVLAGIHSSLRSQTQQRLDEGFLGFDTQTQRNFARANHWIGVGKRNRSVPASSLTSSALNGDFTRTAANASGVNIHGSDPVLIVIKKNVSILKNLITWLAGKGETLPDGRKLLRGLPLLLIDDEADNASINVSKDNISATNAAIRVLLSLFEQRAYVGYTATPFANVFIPLLKEADYKSLGLNINAFDYAIGQELFPRDFIVNIPPPSNYVGPDRIFGIGEPEEEDNDSHERTLPVLRIIDDYLGQIPDKHRKDDDLPDELPGSLKEAVLAFLLSCASRFARGQVKQHSSMLIHVSRFVRWQNHIGYLVNDYFEECRASLLLKNSLTEQYLKELWEDDYLPSTNEVIDRRLVDDPLLVPLTWEQVQPQLHAVAQRIKVRVVHGTPDKTGSQLHKPLDYIEFDGTGLLVIAIGGNKLSRGLTLEGLCVSYYLRASRMYDTLMQMGRWFGYRPGYADMCRLYTSEELVSWYRHVTMATEELRLEFDRMVRLRRAPKEYGLKIRSKPGVLQITATNRMRGAWKLQLSYAAELMETYSFPRRDPAFIRHNYEATCRLTERLGAPQPDRRQKYFWPDVPVENVLDFLSEYRTLQRNIEPAKLTEYIRKQNEKGFIVTWTVVLMEADRDVNPLFDFPIGGETVAVRSTYRRQAGSDKIDPAKLTEYVIPKAHIISPRHEYLDLSKEQFDRALGATQTRRPKATIPAGDDVREKRPDSRALLLLYPLDPEPAGYPREGAPVMGYAISFPAINGEEKVEYMGNLQLLQEFESPDDDYLDAEADREITEDSND